MKVEISVSENNLFLFKCDRISFLFDSASVINSGVLFYKCDSYVAGVARGLCGVDSSTFENTVFLLTLFNIPEHKGKA